MDTATSPQSDVLDFFTPGGGADAMVARVKSEALPFVDGPVFYLRDKSLNVADLEVPEWIEAIHYEHAEDAFTEAAGYMADERTAMWEQADLFAYLYTVTKGTISRGQLFNRLGASIGASAQTARRRAKMGMIYPPDVRDLQMAERCYLAAFVVEDPVALIRTALDNGWCEDQIREHIATGEQPPLRLSLLDEHYAPDYDAEDVLTLVNAILSDARTRGGGPLLELRVRVDAVYATEGGQGERQSAVLTGEYPDLGQLNAA